MSPTMPVLMVVSSFGVGSQNVQFNKYVACLGLLSTSGRTGTRHYVLRTMQNGAKMRFPWVIVAQEDDTDDGSIGKSSAWPARKKSGFRSLRSNEVAGRRRNNFCLLKCCACSSMGQQDDLSSCTVDQWRGNFASSAVDVNRLTRSTKARS